MKASRDSDFSTHAVAFPPSFGDPMAIPPNHLFVTLKDHIGHDFVESSPMVAESLGMVMA